MSQKYRHCFTDDNSIPEFAVFGKREHYALFAEKEKRKYVSVLSYQLDYNSFRIHIAADVICHLVSL